MTDAWTDVSLEEVCTLITDGSHFSPATSEQGYPYVTVRDVRDGRIYLSGALRVPRDSFDDLSRNGCQPRRGDVLFSKDGTVGRVALVSTDEPFVVLSSLAILRPDTDRVVPGYLSYALQAPAFQEAATGQKTGLAIKRVVLKNLKQMTFPLPPLPVQRRIVDLMEHLDKHLENLRAERDAVRRSASALRRATFASLSDRGTSAASEMFEMLLGRQKSARQTFGEHVIPYLRAANISDSGLKLDDVLTMNFSPEEQTRYCLVADDILVVEGGTVGLAVRWQEELAGPVGFDKHVIRVRARRERSTSEFALQWAKWARETGAFDAQATGITIRALGFGRASAMPVPNVGLEEQIRLFEPLARLDILLDRLREEERTFVILRESLLGDALSAKRVLPESYDVHLNSVA